MEHLYEKLKTYGESDVYPFHMPGHKRQMRWEGDPYQMDITEIDGFDNLHHAEEILKETQERAAALYGSEEAFLLVNGSTCGLLSAVCAAASRGDTLLVARNCHKAVYHAMYLNALKGEYLVPKWNKNFGIYGGIAPEEVEQALTKHPEISAVILTSPTYEGIVSDIPKIAKICHEHQTILIVDEAHGAHFGIADGFPESAVTQGADLVIQSMHKTLPALTQTALLHVNGTLVDRERLRFFLQTFQTSSPSYVFMAGMERCITMLESEKQKETAYYFLKYEQKLETFYNNVRKNRITPLRVLEGIEKNTAAVARDPSKIVISAAGTLMSGEQLYHKLLETYHLQMEMASTDYVIAMTSFMDTKEGMERLLHALLEISKELRERKGQTPNVQTGELLAKELPLLPESVETIFTAKEAKKEKCLLKKSAGKISGEFIYAYPPGSPLLVPGERISEKFLAQFQKLQDAKLNLMGLKDHTMQEIEVLI